MVYVPNHEMPDVCEGNYVGPQWYLIESIVLFSHLRVLRGTELIWDKSENYGGGQNYIETSPGTLVGIRIDFGQILHVGGD